MRDEYKEFRQFQWVYAGNSIWLTHPIYPPQQILVRDGKLVMEEIKHTVFAGESDPNTILGFKTGVFD